MIAGMTPVSLMEKIKVFISYSHDSEEHRQRVLEFSDQLRDDGVDCWLDQYINGATVLLLKVGSAGWSDR